MFQMMGILFFFSAVALGGNGYFMKEAYDCQIQTQEGYLLNDLQHCDRIKALQASGKAAELDGRVDCIAEHWSRDDKGKSVSHNFGWLTFRKGKREGAGEIKAFSMTRGNAIYKLNFKDDRLDGKIVWIGENEKKNRCELEFEKGVQKGPARKFSASGKLIEVRYFEPEKDGHRSTTKLEIDYCTNGKVYRFQCADKSLVPEDKALCGFDGKPVTSAETECDSSKEGRTYVLENGRASSVSYRESAKDPAGKEVLFSVVDSSAPPVSPWAGRDASHVSKSVWKYPSGRVYRSYQYKYSGNESVPVGEFVVNYEDGSNFKTLKFKGEKGFLETYRESYMNGAARIEAQAIDETRTRVTYRPSAEGSLIVHGEYVDADASYSRYRSGTLYDIRIDMREEFGHFGAFVIVPKKIRLTDDEAERTETYEKGELHGEIVEKRPAEDRKLVLRYEAGELKNVKTYTLDGKKLITEHQVLPDGSKKLLRAARPGA